MVSLILCGKEIDARDRRGCTIIKYETKLQKRHIAVFSLFTTDTVARNILLLHNIEKMVWIDFSSARSNRVTNLALLERDSVKQFLYFELICNIDWTLPIDSNWMILMLSWPKVNEHAIKTVNQDHEWVMGWIDRSASWKLTVHKRLIPINTLCNVLMIPCTIYPIFLDPFVALWIFFCMDPCIWTKEQVLF